MWERKQKKCGGGGCGGEGKNRNVVDMVVVVKV